MFSDIVAVGTEKRNAAREDMTPTQELIRGADLNLTQAGKLFGVRSDTIKEWIFHGVKHGDRWVKLRAVRIGNRYRTSQTWLDEFIRAINEPEIYTPTPQVEREDVRTRRAKEAQARVAKMLGRDK